VAGDPEWQGQACALIGEFQKPPKGLTLTLVATGSFGDDLVPNSLPPTLPATWPCFLVLVPRAKDSFLDFKRPRPGLAPE
jgi:hypothetical protein